MLLGFDGPCQNDLGTLHVVERLPENVPAEEASSYIVVGSNRPSEAGTAGKVLFANDGRSAATILNAATLMFEVFNRWERELCSCAGNPDGLQKASERRRNCAYIGAPSRTALRKLGRRAIWTLKTAREPSQPRSRCSCFGANPHKCPKSEAQFPPISGCNTNCF